MTARIPRSGFCIVYDAIPIEVAVENGSGRSIRIQVSLKKTVTFKACGHYNFDTLNVLNVTSEAIPGHTTTVFSPPPIAIPETQPTLANSDIISVDYVLQVICLIHLA